MKKLFRKWNVQIALVMVAVLTLSMMPGVKAYAVASNSGAAWVYKVWDGGYDNDLSSQSGTVTVTSSLPIGASVSESYGTSITIHIGPFSDSGVSVPDGTTEIWVNVSLEASQAVDFPSDITVSYSGKGYSGTIVCTTSAGNGTLASYEGRMTMSSSSGSSSGETSEEEQARLEEERKSSHFEVISTGGEKMESEVKGSFYYEQGAAVVKGDDAICRDKDDYAVNTYVANETCQSAAYASLTGYATEGGYTVTAATSFNIIDLENNPFCDPVSWFDANENNTISGTAKTFTFSDGRSITTDKFTTAIAGLPESVEGKVIVVGVTKGGAVFTQEDQDDDPATVTFNALLGNGVYGFLVK